MAQVILIENNENLNDLISINLKNFLGADIIPRDNAEDAIDLLALLPSVNLIITKNEIQGDYCALNLANYIRENQLNIDMIVLGPFAHPGENIVVIDDPSDWEKVVSTSASLLGISKDIFKKKVTPDYMPIPAKYFFHIEETFCDVFIRIRKSQDQYQFVKRIHSGDSFSKSLILRYISQGLKDFYVGKDHIENFTNFVSNQLVKKLKENINDDLDNKIEVLADSYNVATQEILKLGFNSATIELSDTIIQSMLQTFKANPRMSHLLRKILNSTTSYTYQHSHMTSIVASQILDNLNLKDDAHHQVMAYASFFSNICFAEHDELAKITSYEELEEATLSGEQWDLVLNHALDAAQIAKTHPEIPGEVAEVIKCHHGSPSGKGFSTGHIASLNGLAKIFLISSEFVKEVLSFKEKGGSPGPVIGQLKLKYPGDDMKKVVLALEKTLKTKQ